MPSASSTSAEPIATSGRAARRAWRGAALIFLLSAGLADAFLPAAQTSDETLNSSRPQAKAATRQCHLDHEGLRFVTRARPDLADAIDGFTLRLQLGHRGFGISRRNDDDQADAAVEDAMHFVLGDIAFGLHP